MDIKTVITSATGIAAGLRTIKIGRISQGADEKEGSLLEAVASLERKERYDY